MMKTKYHLSIFLIALFAGLMAFATDVAAKKDKKPPVPGGYENGYPKAMVLHPSSEDEPSPIGIMVKWFTAKDKETNILYLRYRVRWKKRVGGDTWHYYPSDKGIHMLDHFISNLDPNTTYVVDVIVKDRDGNETLYGEREVTTPPAVEPGEYVDVSSTTLTTITLEWKMYLEKYKYLKKHPPLFQVKSRKTTESNWSHTLSGQVDPRVNPRCDIHGLEPGTEYVVDVEFCNGDFNIPLRGFSNLGERVIKTLGNPTPKPKPNPEQPGNFSVHPKELTVDAKAQVQTVTISGDKKFFIEYINKPDWFLVDPSEPSYGENLTMGIRFKENTGAERKADVVFKTNAGDVTLKVTQRAASSTPSEPEQPATLTLEPKELTAVAKGDGKLVTLSCNKPYRVNNYDSPYWLLLTEYSSDYKKRQTLKITVKKNPGAERTGEITIKTTEGNVKLKVTQRGTGSTPSAKLTLDPKELTSGPNWNNQEVTLSCDELYYIKAYDAPDWLSASWINSNYEKSHNLRIVILQNTGAERTGEITIKTSEGDVKLKVTQRAASSTPSATLTLDPMALTMKYHRNEAEVTLACSDKAFSINQVVIDQLDWLSATGGSGLYKKHFIRITAQENPGAKRSGTVTFKTSEGEATLHVTQEAKSTAPPTLTLTPTTLTFPASGGASQSVAVKSSVEGWGVRLKDRTQDWLTVTPDAAAKTVIVTVKPNTGTKKRSAEVEVVSDAGLTRSFFVTQQGNRPPEAVSGLSLNPEAMTMGGSSGAVGFTLKSDKPWTVAADADWLHPGSTRGNAGTTYFRLRFDQNTTGAVRTGKLTFTTTDGKATKTFTLTQRVGSAKPKPSTPSEGTYDYDLAVNPESITLSGEGGGSSIDVVTHRLWAGSTADDWITLEKAVGRGDGSFDFTVAPNPSKEMRHGKITVRTEHGMDELTIAIHQQGQTGDIVLPGAVKVSGLTLDPATLVVDGDISTTLISALVSPENAANKSLLWMSSNPSVATVSVLGQKRSGVALLPQLRFAPDADDYALVTIAGKGKATITAATSDGSGIVARCEIEVRSTVGNVVPYAPAAKIYATPGTLHLTLPQATRVEIYTLLGIRLRTLDAPTGDTSVTLPRGLYIVRAGSAVQKVRVE